MQCGRARRGTQGYMGVTREIGVDAVVDVFFFSSRRRHTRLQGDWSSDVCSSDLLLLHICPDRLVFGVHLIHGEERRRATERARAGKQALTEGERPARDLVVVLEDRKSVV